MYNDTTYFLRLAMPSFEQVPNLDSLLALAHDIGSATAMEDLLQRLTSAASELQTMVLIPTDGLYWEMRGIECAVALPFRAGRAIFFSGGLIL